jgi:hypothetical protein
MADVAQETGFEVAAAPLIAALKEMLGERFRVFPFFEAGGDKGIGVVPDRDRERRIDPSRYTLQLRLTWPEPAWMDFAHASEQQRRERAAAFAEMFEERLSALEGWYGFQLDSSSQQVQEPIDMKFEVIGVGNIPGVDGDIV